MSLSSEMPNGIERYIDPDGRLTLEGLKLFQRMISDLEAMDARIAVLEP